jgi:hypothetical protein
MAGQVADAGEALFDALECAARLLHQLLAGFGQRDRAGRAAHQRHARGTLEFGDPHADRRLGHAQPARSLRVAARAARAAGIASIEHWINGRIVPGQSGRRADVFNPATGQVSGQVALANARRKWRRPWPPRRPPSRPGPTRRRSAARA